MTRWAFEGLLDIESRAFPELVAQSPPGIHSRGPAEHRKLVETVFSADVAMGTACSCGVLSSMTGLLLAIAMAILRAKDIH